VTDSFHGTVFSILFNRPFTVIQNQNRGNDRLFSLLEDFELLDRLIISENQLTKELVFKNINWNKVNERLEKRRKYSLEALLTHLV
jgi:exopolysaccharide biosynthesis predicted pyruvyltransferase EpsI